MHFLSIQTKLKIVSRLRHTASALALGLGLEGALEGVAAVIEEGWVFGGVALVAERGET